MSWPLDREWGGQSSPKTLEAEIDGQRVPYDACSSDDSLEDAKAYYEKAFEYFGSGHVYFVNGTRNQSKTLMHFFRRKLTDDDDRG